MKTSKLSLATIHEDLGIFFFFCRNFNLAVILRLEPYTRIINTCILTMQACRVFQESLQLNFKYAASLQGYFTELVNNAG